jgi:hypothetical protein
MSMISLKTHLQAALKSDYFLPFLITSQTAAKYKSTNLPYGLGKSTLALWISYELHNHDWEAVFRDLCYYPSEVLEKTAPDPDRKEKVPCIVWDAVQATAPAAQSVPGIIRDMAGRLSESRPEMSILVMTAPNFNSIAAPLRHLVVFEIIVFDRGYYEVQKIVYRKNFQNPLQDLVNLEYIEGTDESVGFPPLPDEIQRRYDVWRASKKSPRDKSLLDALENFERKLAGEEEAVTPSEASELARALVRKRWDKKVLQAVKQSQP